MNKSLFMAIYLSLAVVIVIIAFNMMKSNSRQLLVRDLEWNQKVMIQMIEDFYIVENRNYYPENLADLLYSNIPYEGEKLRIPYHNGTFKVTHDGGVHFKAGNILYVVTSRDKRSLPSAYSIYLLGKQTDFFFDEEKAGKWRDDYIRFNKLCKGPDNIVMVSGNSSKINDRD